MKKLFSFLFLFAFLPLMATLNWSAPTTISDSGVTAYNPSTGIDSSGNVVAIWLENTTVMASNLPIGGSWSTPVAISGSSSSSPEIVVDSNGNATAIWVTSGAIQTATKLFNQSWGSATTLASSGSSMPQMAVDPSGDVVAVWVSSGVIYSSTKLFGGSWPVTPNTLSTTSESNSPQVAIGAGGNVIAIWHAMWPTTSMNTIFVAGMTIGGGWTTATPISNSYQNSVYPQVAVDSNGNASAIWFTYNMAGDNAYVNVMLQTAMMDATNSLWSDPVRLTSPSACIPSTLMAQVAYDQLGNAMAFWTDSYNGTKYSLAMAYMQLSNGTLNWIGPITVSFDAYCYAFDFSILSNSDVYAAFMAVDASNNISVQAAQSHLGGWTAGFWNNVTELSTAVTNSNPQMAAVALSNNTSYATAVWVAWNGTNRVIQASTASQSMLLPASNLAVTQSSKALGVFTEYYNTVTWTASTDPNASYYIIYRNGVVLSSVKGPTWQYIDINQPQNATAVYSVVASDSTGMNQSAIVSVTLN